MIKKKGLAVRVIVVVLLLGIVIGTGAIINMISQPRDEEGILKSFVNDINKRETDALKYCVQRRPKEEQDYYEYYCKLLDKYMGDKEMDGLNYDEIMANINYENEIKSLEEMLGEDFTIEYEIKDKREASEFYVEVIEEQLEYWTEREEDSVEEFCEELRNNLKEIDVPEKKIDKCIDLYEKTFNCDYKLTNVYYVDLEYNIKGEKDITVEDTIVFADIDNKVYAIGYTDNSDDEEECDEYGFGGLTPYHLLRLVEDELE